MSFITRLVLLTLGLTPIFGVAQINMPDPNWDRARAMGVVDSPRSTEVLDALYDLLYAENERALEQRLDAIIAGALDSQPVRDYVLFTFALSLADAPQARSWMFERLGAVEPAVYVSHPDRPSVGIPLFNIRGAAQGAMHHNLRRAAEKRALDILAASPEIWFEAYLAADPVQQKGFVDALPQTGDDTLAIVLADAVEALPSSPAATAVAGRSALFLGDLKSLKSVIVLGTGRDVAEVLDAAAATLDDGALLELLEVAIRDAPASNASLTIAELFPALVDNAPARSLVLDLLADRSLGASAALAVAQADDPDLVSNLRDVSRTGDELAAKRASLALEMIDHAGRLER